jgi:hypothetical protein
MYSITKSVAATTCLALLAAAAPASQGASALNPRWIPCATGTWYSKCGDIDGCFNYDPCVGGAPPVQEPPVEEPPSCGSEANQRVKVMPSSYWPISPNTPDVGYTAVPNFHAFNTTDTVTEVVLVFEGIDTTRAQTCSIGWYLKNLQEETVFEVDGDGYLRITQLPGHPVPQTPPTYNSALSYETEDSVTTMPALGGWDERPAYLGMSSGGGIELPCSEVMVFRAYLDPVNNGGGEILFSPSETIGISVDYTTC